MNRKTKILIVDDYRASRELFELHLCLSEHYELLESLSSADEAVKYCDKYDVDLVIMDVLMVQGIDGITAAEQIKSRHPNVKILLTTGTAETGWEERARKVGVEGFWYKEYSRDKLSSVVDRIVAGESVFSSAVASSIKFGNTTRDALSEFDLDVLRELVGGYSNEEAARRLGVAVDTVRYHIKTMCEKTGFKNRVLLVANATRLGIVVHDDSMKPQ